MIIEPLPRKFLLFDKGEIIMTLGYELYPVLWAGFDIASFSIRLLSLALIPQRHSPTTATAWLLVILLWPWPGIIAYSLLGTNLLPKRRLERHNAALSHFNDIRARMRQKDLPGAVRPALPPSLEATANLAQNLGYLNAVQGNSVAAITHAEEFIETLIDEIDRARSEIDMLYYIFNDDSYGRKVIDACRRAAKRGVTVRLLLDSVGSRDFLHGAMVKEIRREGVFVDEALPVRFYRVKAARFDLRNHRKLAIFDRRVAVTGSHNVTEPSYGRFDNLIWKDVSLKLEGPVVRQLESVFIEDWYVETGEMLDTPHLFAAVDFPGDACLQTVPSGPSYTTENYQRLIIASIISAQRQVTITTPYLIPDEGMLQAVEVARLRGVKVRLVIPAKSDQIIVGYASRAYYNEFLRRGVDIYLYGKGLLHSKTMTVDDDLGFVGSSNFDIRSFALNFEINMILYGTRENLSLHRIQRMYICESHRLTEAEWQKRGHVSMALESVTKLLSPLL